MYNEQFRVEFVFVFRYLFAYEDLSKKLGSMNAPSAYFGGRTSLGSDSRRSLIRVRQQQQEEEKAQKKVTKSKQSPASVKQRVCLFDEKQFHLTVCFHSLVKVMNLDLLLIRNKLLQRKNQHRNLLRLLRIAKDLIVVNHRMSFLQVHQNQKTNPKVNHPIINQVVLHHQITRRIKRKYLRHHLQVQHQRNLRSSLQQYRRKPLNQLRLLRHHQLLLKLM